MDDPRGAVDRESFREAARAAPAGARVPVELRTTVADPFRAYRRARRDAGGFYLETTGGQSGWGYFGVAPAERLTVGPVAVVADELVDDASDDSGRSDEPGGCSRGTGRAADSASLSALGGLLDGETLARGDCEVPYPCGAVGWLSYDVARELESLPATTTDDRTLPRLQVGVYDALVAWPEPRDGPVELRVTVCPRIPGEVTPDAVGDGSDAAADAANDSSGDALDDIYDRARERGRALVDRIQEGDPGVADPPVDADEATFTSECGRAEYADRVRRVKELIRAGDTFQANVAQRLVAPAAVHPVEAFDALRAVNPAPYAGLVEFPGVDLVSASPELLLHVEPPDGLNAGRFGEFDPPDRSRLVTEPIAGTRPRDDDPDADEVLARDLVGDEKERAEHAMLVDLERNDLGKVAAYGSVDVAEYRRVDRYAEVMHLVSLVDGRLREDRSVVDAVAATFPGGTITGAPKPRTMEIIESVEDRRRGPYTGSIGLFGFDGRATLNIVIRTLVRTGEEYGLRVGAGIVHDSDPQREYEETLDKARALVTAVDRALDRRDLAVEGGGGDPEEAVDPASEPDGGSSR